MIPPATPVVIAELNSLGLDISAGTQVDEWGALPAVRVAKTGDHEEPSRWEATPLFQCEVWASSEGEADDLASLIADRWWSFTAHTVSIDGSPWATVFGRWVEVAPYPLPNPDDTEYARVVLSLGIRLSGVSNG